MAHVESARITGASEPLALLRASLKEAAKTPGFHVSCSLNSSNGVILGIIKGTTIGVIKGDTRSLDYGSCGLGFRVFHFPFSLPHSLPLSPKP